MKIHLNVIKSQNGNETHPIDSPIWEQCDLKINQRPGNLIEEEVRISSVPSNCLTRRQGTKSISRTFGQRTKGLLRKNERQETER